MAVLRFLGWEEIFSLGSEGVVAGAEVRARRPGADIVKSRWLMAGDLIEFGRETVRLESAKAAS